MRTLDELIAGARVFAGLEPAQLELIAGCARNQHFETGGLLLREGDPADTFFLIRSGTVALELNAPGRGDLRIETLHDGDAVGWSWLFEPYRWQMDARAIEPSSVIAFDGACLRDKTEQDHELGYQLMKRFAANLLETLQATRFQLLDVYGRTTASV
ncbi:MAG: cyclic nucleotide-binding domain-containing protein [Solirubrobacterales bacterium]|nr:cyclic nucleotide-binding domain-containing protein [Solirubrobacterales bacterium]